GGLTFCTSLCSSQTACSEFDNPSLARAQRFQPSVPNCRLGGDRNRGARSKTKRPNAAALAFIRRRHHFVRGHEERRRRAPPSSSTASRSAHARRGSNREWPAETPSCPANRRRNCAG